LQRDQHGEPLAILQINTDITARKRAEQAQAEARDQALAASRMKSEFLATMSHEIRTPMNGVIGMTDLLLETPLDEEQREFATIIRDSGRALLTLIDDILDFSKIEAGKLALESIDFEPLRAVEGAAQLLASKAQEKHLTLLTFVAPDIPPVVQGDPGRLRQILLNLIGNAVKFTAQGEIVVRASLEYADENDVCIRFAVSDTGIGLSQTARRRLFQPFTQADGSTTRQYGGTGLGLAISKRLVELMGGTIGVESVEGQGSTFWFTTRFACVSSATAAARPQARTNLRGLRVLIVDDSPASQEIIASYARSWGMQDGCVADGQEALAELRRAAA
jgi:polar amino acid transport system substrate-binding protein